VGEHTLAELDLDQRSQVIGENLRKYRLLKGLRQEEVAKGLCSVSQLSKVENGKTVLKMSLLKSIADRLGVTVEQLESTDAYQEELRETFEMANTAFAAGNIEKSLELVRVVLEKSQEGGYPSLYAEALLLECRELNRLHRYAEVIERVERVLASDQTATSMDTVIKVNLMVELGRAYETQGDMTRAFELYFRADEEFQTIEVIDERCMRDLFVLAVSHYRMRNYRTGLRYVSKVEQIAVELAFHTWRIYAQSLKTKLYTHLGEYEKAREIFPKLLEEAQKQALIEKVGDIQNNYGCLYMAMGEYGEAQSHLQKSVKMYELLGEEVEMSSVYLNLVEAAYREREYARAATYMEQVQSLLQRLPSNRTYQYRARAQHLQGKLHAASGDFAQYVQALQGALEIYDQHGVVLEAYDVAVELADALYEKGEDNAVEMYRKAVEYRNKSRLLGMKK